MVGSGGGYSGGHSPENIISPCGSLNIFTPPTMTFQALLSHHVPSTSAIVSWLDGFILRAKMRDA